MDFWFNNHHELPQEKCLWNKLNPSKNAPNEKKSIVHEKAIPKHGIVQELVQQDF